MRASASSALIESSLVPDGVAHAVHVGHQHELARAEAGGDARRGVVGVHVAHDAILVPRERRHHRHLVGDEQRVEEVAPDARRPSRRARRPAAAGR